jgi:hypothetical protein
MKERREKYKGNNLQHKQNYKKKKKKKIPSSAKSYSVSSFPLILTVLELFGLLLGTLGTSIISKECSNSCEFEFEILRDGLLNSSIKAN